MKIRLLTLYFFVFFTVFSSFGQIPSGYYNGTEGLTGVALKAKLHSIIKNHSAQSYSSLMTYFQETDKKSNNTVWDIYSDVPEGTPPYVYHFISSDECGSYNQEGDCFNKEHSFPQSWFNENMPMKSDLFHIYPTDGYVNGKRSNYPYGDVNNPEWTSENGSKLGSCVDAGYSGTVFEPIDDYKGDLARTYFYMATRYYTEDSSWPGSGMVNGCEPRPWAMTMLMNWANADPVSQKEIDRNNAVYQIQDNRNPFIDHQEFMDAIWGDPSVIGEHISIHFSVFPNPVTDILHATWNNTSSMGSLHVALFDMTGKEVFTKTSAAGESEWVLDVSGLSKGFYLLVLHAADGNIHARYKIIK